MNIGTIKIRPVVLVIALGMVVALNAVVFMHSELTTVVVAVIGTITTGIVGVATKLIESEEKSE